MTTYESFKFHQILRALSVWFTFMVINFLWYGLSSPSDYVKDIVGKCLWTALFAFAFTAIYNHASTWRPKVGEPATPGDLGHRILNSLFFSFVIFLMILAAIAFSHYIISVVFIYVLDGFRGSPEDMVDNLALATEVVAGGLVLELHAKQETSERRDG